MYVTFFTVNSKIVLSEALFDHFRGNLNILYYAYVSDNNKKRPPSPNSKGLKKLRSEF